MSLYEISLCNAGPYENKKYINFNCSVPKGSRKQKIVLFNLIHPIKEAVTMKNNSLIEEQLIKLPLGFYGPGKENQTQDFLLFIIRFEALRIEGINKKAENYLNFFKKELSQEDAFLEEIVHPEDYPRFLTYLKSFKTSDLNKWEKITIRLRNERGGWKEFLLEQRIYSVGTHQEKMLLTIVTEVDDFLISEENGSKGTSVAEKAFFESRNKYQLLLYSLDEAFCSIEMIFEFKVSLLIIYFWKPTLLLKNM